MVEKRIEKNLPAPENDPSLHEEILYGVPNREALESLDEIDKVMFSAFGLRRDGEKPYYPTVNSAVEAVYKDFIKGGTKYERYQKFVMASAMYQENLDLLINDFIEVNGIPQKASKDQKQRVERLREYLKAQGYKSEIKSETLKELATRNIKPGKLAQIIIPKPKEQTDPKNLESRGFIIDKYR